MNHMARMIGLLLCLTSFCVFGQTKSSGGYETNSKNIQIDDIEFEIKKVEVKDIRFDNDGAEMPNIRDDKRLDWVQIIVEYRWKLNANGKKDKKIVQQGDNRYWLERLDFDWRIVFAQATDGGAVRDAGGKFNIRENLAIRMEKSVTYRNIDDDGDHFAVLFIDGHVLRRYMKRFSSSQFFIELKIKLNGKNLAIMNSHGEQFAATIFTKEDDEENSKERKAREAFIPKTSSKGASFYESDSVKESQSAILNRQESPWRWNKDSALEQIDQTVKPSN